MPPLVYAGARYGDVSVEAAIFVGILSAAVLLWVFSLVDEFIPPVVVVVATLFIGLAPPSVALAGFASPSFVTLLGVFALAATIGSSGLSGRVMLRLLAWLPDRPFYHRLVPLLGGWLLSPITPSGNNRMALLLPVYDGLVEGLRLPKGSAAATAVFAATYSGAMLFSPMLATSKSSNVAAIALLPPQVQEDFLSSCRRNASLVSTPESRSPTSTHPAIQAGFLFFLVGAATVSWHHVKPAWIAGCVLV
ncbi:MAG: hypothetical protein EBX35_13930, partial [Planctomycetia bacterium]|nr:hypothetical protein [Planctomycetia bacterium]